MSSYLRKLSISPSPPSQHSFFSELKDEVVGICNFTWFLNSFDYLGPISHPLEEYFSNREAS